MGVSTRIESCVDHSMVATRLRELEVWQLADTVRRAFIPLLRKDVVKRDFDFIDQTRKATRSACRNIAEGFYRFRHPEFANFVNIAIGSLGELVDGTDDALEHGYIDRTEHQRFNDLLEQALASAIALE